MTNEEVHKDYFASLAGDGLDQEKVVHEPAEWLTASNRGRIVAAVGELPLNSFQARKQVAQIAYDLFSSDADVKVKSGKGPRPFWRGREDDDYS